MPLKKKTKSAEQKPLIRAEKIVNRFGETTVHDQLDFEIFPGEIIGVVGGSGSGKSVLLKTLIGLRQPTSGKIYIKDKSLQDATPEEFLKIQKMWGVLFQHGALFSNQTVQENIEFQLREHTGLSNSLIQELALMKIKMVGLDIGAAKKYPSELSGGMIKRAALARALALDPHILFLDEPTSGLDPISATKFDELLLELVNNLGIAVFMITHDLDSLFKVSDRVAVLVDKKIKTGTIQDMQREQHPWINDYFNGERAPQNKKRKG